MQCERNVDAADEYEFVGQSVHVMSFVVSQFAVLYLPAAQLVEHTGHVLPLLKKPELHSHCEIYVEPSGELELSGHSVQEPTGPKYLALHLHPATEAAPAPEFEFVGHAGHVMSAFMLQSVFLYVPARQPAVQPRHVSETL
jgi:hypothetical protein